MGIAILPLQKASDDPGRAVPFEVYVIYKGLNRGILKGRIQIDWREDDQKRVNPILTPRRAPRPVISPIPTSKRSALGQGLIFFVFYYYYFFLNYFFF